MLKEKDNLSTNQIISLMSIYLSEWEHRDNILWSQVFKMFYANLMVIILPNAADFLGISLPTINNDVFPIIGMVMAIVFLYIGLGYVYRLKASGLTYAKVMNLLGDTLYQRTSLRSIPNGNIFSSSIAHILVIAMFIVLEALAVAVLFV